MNTGLAGRMVQFATLLGRYEGADGDGYQRAKHNTRWENICLGLVLGFYSDRALTTLSVSLNTIALLFVDCLN